MKIFISGKHGEGKSTIATLIDYLLKQQGFRTKLVTDSDPMVISENRDKIINAVRNIQRGTVIDIVECQERRTSTDEDFRAISDDLNYEIIGK